jgi:hypothetical protein
MRRISTTVLALVGTTPPDERHRLAATLGEGANVRAVLPDVEAPPLDRAVAAWSEAVRAHIPYVVHDADPLADVAAAWIDRWDGHGDVGRLEVAVSATRQRWRAGTLELPDYYLVVDPHDLGATARHWYLGVLAGAAPHRVAVTDDDSAEVARTVRRLRAGRWWPDLDVLLDGIDRRVPDALEVQAGPQQVIPAAPPLRT